MRKLITTALVLLTCVLTAVGRLLPNWPYEKLFTEADVVVIAEPLSTIDTTDVFSFGDYKPEDFTGMNTKLRVSYSLKGDVKNGEISVLHFRYSDKLHMVADGALFVHFRIKTRAYKGEVFHQSSKDGNPDEPERVDKLLTPPDYLLFLKRRSDGRYEPVSGQYDSALSCREVSSVETELAFHRFDD